MNRAPGRVGGTRSVDVESERRRRRKSTSDVGWRVSTRYCVCGTPACHEDQHTLLRGGSAVGRWTCDWQVAVQFPAGLLSTSRSTQPSIPPGSLHRVPISAGCKGGILTSVGWQTSNTVRSHMACECPVAVWQSFCELLHLLCFFTFYTVNETTVRLATGDISAMSRWPVFDDDRVLLCWNRNYDVVS